MICNLDFRDRYILRNKGGSEDRDWVGVLVVMIGVVNLPCRDQRHENYAICNVWYVCGLCKLGNVSQEAAVLKCLTILLRN